MFYCKYHIRNEKRYWYDVAHSGSVAFLPARDGNLFSMNTSTLDQYIPNSTSVYHLVRSDFASWDINWRGVVMFGLNLRHHLVLILYLLEENS